MHANRNKKAVKRVEKGMMKANRIRNLFAVFAIVLTTFMITTVFSLGINYMENMKLMQVRTAGTTANASLAMPTEKQEQQIKNLEYVKTVGTQYMVGSVAEKNDEGRDLSIALSYYDTTEWDKHYKETIKDIEGKYPSDENEIMLITTGGIIIQIPMSDVSILGRITSGVKLINLTEGVTVASVAKVRDKEEKDTNAQQAAVEITDSAETEESDQPTDQETQDENRGEEE